MVTFFDPIQNKELSYHIERKVKEKWDKIRFINGKSKLVKQDDDRVYIVDGRERTGKSVFALQQAKYLNPNFSLEDVCYSPEQFLERIRKAPKGSVIVFDEAFRGLSSKGSQSKVNKKIVQAMMEMGQRNLIVFIVLPTFFLLEMYAAVLRSHVLFHVFKDKRGKRRVKVYNYQKKSLLYNVGKKKGFSYSFPKVNLHARFYDKYAINEEEYRKKKHQSLIEADKENFDPEEERFKQERKYYLANLAHWLKKEKNLSQTKVCACLKEVGIPIEHSNLSKVLVEVRKEGKIANFERGMTISKGVNPV